LRPVNVVRKPSAADDKGVFEDNEGIWANGMRKARKLQGLDGRELHVRRVRSMDDRTYSVGTDHVRGE
jgi:hypothetical protein